MSLTDLAIKRAAPGAKIIKLSDGGGLQLWITPDGAKRWRLAYRFGGAQKTFAIGVYPEVGLRDARDAREGAKQTLANGQDPTQVKKGRKGCAGGRGREHVRDHRGRIGGQEASRQEGGGNVAKVRMVHELRASGLRITTYRRHHGS